VASLALAVLGLASMSVPAFAAPGAPDPTFSGDGVLLIPKSVVNSVLVQANAKLLAVGDMETGDASTNDLSADFMLARYQADGKPDDSFAGDGVVTTDLGNRDEAYGEARQPDGKILVVGCSRHPDGSEEFVLARYTGNGTLDDTFSGDGIVEVAVPASRLCDARVAVTPDDEIVVTESTGFGGSNPQPLVIARYRNDGALDRDFSSDGEKTVPVPGFFGDGITVEPNGKIVIAGTSFKFNGQADYRWTVARLEPNGHVDRTFSKNGIASPRFASCYAALGDSVALQAKGRIVTGGYALGCGSTGDDFALARYLRDGRLDHSFAGDGRQTTDFTNAIGQGESLDYAFGLAARPRAKIVLAGHGGDDEGFGPGILSRYRYDGRLDHSFSGDGRVVTNRTCFGWDAAAIRDAKIVVGGGSGGCHSPPGQSPPDEAVLARFEG
jgi:uncharacterized delta-60 repeat protein